MPQDFIGWLGLADIAAMAMFAVRLSLIGLFRAYPALYAHAIIECLVASLPLVFPLSPRSYAQFYMATSPVLWALWILITISLYRLTLKPQQGLLTAGRATILMALGIGLTLVVFSLGADFSHWGKPEWPLAATFLGDRTLTLVLAVFLLALCVFLAWFRVPIKRNCAYFCMGLGLIFITRSTMHFIRNSLGDDVTLVTNVIQLVATSGTFFAWTLLVSRAGEIKIAFVGRRASPAEVEAAVRRAREAAGLARHEQEKTFEKMEDSWK